jgi:hypothetical protein
VSGHLTARRSRRWPAATIVVLAAALPYLPAIDDYFVQDDFGVVGLLSGKPAGYFPRWFVTTWMDDIWGYTPDEVRPFPAVTYQMAALWGAGSPVADHVVNIALHAVNAWLVLGLGEAAAGLSLGPAMGAALVFALLPMQSESVAWITGRVDSMPAGFYLASLLLFARWRANARPALYGWSVLLCFVALFSKQNTVTLVAVLALYDTVVGRRRVQLSWAWLRPYVPFVLLTAGYLALRYVLFGEIAREGMITAERVGLFAGDLSTHLRRMVLGEPGLQVSGTRMAVSVAAIVAAVLSIGMTLGEPGSRRLVRPVLFLVAWIALAVAPTVVAGYASPRHMYLASAGWALGLGLALQVLWSARPAPYVRVGGTALFAGLLVWYGAGLAGQVRAWGIRAAVSRQAVADVEREALAAPPGTLILAVAPRRSWDFALPHALRPPFTREDLTRRVTVISHSSLHCCPAHLWEAYTRRALRGWMTHPDRPPVVVLHWNATSGAVSRLSDRDDPFLRSAMAVLSGAADVAALDQAILDVTNKLVVGRRP